MNKKQVFIRVRKVAPKRYLIEQRRKFLFWKSWKSGCPALGLEKPYTSVLTACSAAKAQAKRKNLQLEIVES